MAIFQRRFSNRSILSAAILYGVFGISSGAIAHDVDDDSSAGKSTEQTDWEIVQETGAEVLETIRNAIVSPANALGSAVITVRGSYRYIQANGVPNHSTGKFPNRNNPNSIRAQNYRFRVPVKPKKRGSFRALTRHPFGVALNGVPFDPGTAEFFGGNPRSKWREEAITATGRKKLGLDRNYAHVQPNGAYHYHGIPKGLLSTLGGSKLIGYAADGFPIYYTGQKSGYRLKKGARPSGSGSPGGRYDGTYGADYAHIGGSLDKCNGKTGKTAEFPSGTYFYVVTANYPFYPRCFAGSPDASFTKLASRRAGAGPRRQRGNRRRPPRRGQRRP